MSSTVFNLPFKLKSLEATAITIQLEGGQLILFVSIYFTPSSTVKLIDMSDLYNIFRLKHNTGIDEIIDLNSKHPFWLNDNSQTNTNGINLYNWFVKNSNLYNIKLLSSLHPSHHVRDIHNYLELFIVSSSTCIRSNGVHQHYLKTLDFESDHNAILLPISVRPILSATPTTIPNLSRVNWKRFNHRLDQKLMNNPLNTTYNLLKAEIDNAVDDLQSTIIDPDTQIVLPQTTIDIIKARKRLRRSWQRKNYSHQYTSLISEIKCLNKIIKELIILQRNETYINRLKNIRINNNTFKNIKTVTRYKARSNIPTLELDNNVTATDPQSKANALAAHFASSHRTTLYFGDNTSTENINRFINTIFNDTTPLLFFTDTHLSNLERGRISPFPNNNPFSPEFNFDLTITNLDDFNFCLTRPDTANVNDNIKFISIKDLKSIIMSRNNKKSAGFDGISNFIIRKLSPCFMERLCIIFNNSYNIAYFPTAWKLALIAPIHKVGKPNNLPNSYRPISLLSTISKIYEKFIQEQMVQYCKDFNIIPNEQFANSKKHSAVHAMTVLSSDVNYNLNIKIPTVACSLDNEKAFGTVWNEGLI